jgi:hypothetical protein
MMRRSIALGLAAVLMAWVNGVHAEEPTLANTPPVVVKTEPPAGASDVAVDTTEIRMTFSKKMRDDSWSWVMASKESFPAMTGQPHFLADGRTCVLPVKLEPDKTYLIWLNSAAAQNFEDQDGHKAVPYLLVFKTK